VRVIVAFPPGGPGPFAAFVRDEHARRARVIREADIKPEG